MLKHGIHNFYYLFWYLKLIIVKKLAFFILLNFTMIFWQTNGSTVSKYLPCYLSKVAADCLEFMTI